ncbi:MAG: hypothetical protein LBC49_05580 [Bacteroidales bacterium]|jgi:hypothetical protein|nr:hypothetical protein [Bacteroidales bacterium]
MILERTTPDSITIYFTKDTDAFGVQRLINYARYLEATSQSKAKQADIDKLADIVNKNWWEQNKSRFV